MLTHLCNPPPAIGDIVAQIKRTNEHKKSTLPLDTPQTKSNQVDPGATATKTSRFSTSSNEALRDKWTPAGFVMCGGVKMKYNLFEFGFLKSLNENTNSVQQLRNFGNSCFFSASLLVLCHTEVSDDLPINYLKSLRLVRNYFFVFDSLFTRHF